MKIQSLDVARISLRLPSAIPKAKVHLSCIFYLFFRGKPLQISLVWGGGGVVYGTQTDVFRFILQKGIIYRKFRRPSPLYPSLTPGNIHTLQCERCCVHPWVKFEKKTVEINSKNKKHNLWFSSRPATFEVFIFLHFRGFRDEHPVFFGVFEKSAVEKRESKDQYIEGRHLGYRVPTPSCSFVSFIEWSISKISGTYGK